MKTWICRICYGGFVLLGWLGGIRAVLLFDSHAANGTSVGYFTMIVFPAVLVLLGLTGIRFRYWWIPTGICWLGIGMVLLASGPVEPMLFLLLAVYLLLGMLPGVCGSLLRRTGT